ncbi:GNAT family acetyltransferase [Rhizosaccharibacter radicis]|uniref:GNAT family acetyltransferase n=1 Tax=Rhizosaccharibacter radicis TaxID=2782605 RepID=A0ABT1W185_9PROT|nr:GNAT family acetyltransferase [Acetobacteraceae bacterium KSS12]
MPSRSCGEAVAGDEVAAVALWKAAGLAGFGNDPVADFHLALLGPSSAVLVAEDAGGTISGTVMVGHDGHRGWLYYVAVAPAARGQGVGRHLVAVAEQWLRARGTPKVQLMVRPANAAVAGFYHRLGYAEAPRVVMAKRLDGSDAVENEPR